MKTFYSVLLLVFCIAAALVQGYPADSEENEKNWKPMPCLGGQITLPDKFKTSLKGCHNTTMPAGKMEKNMGDHQQMMKSCLVVCVGQGMGILDTSGKPVKDKIASSLKEIFPGAAQQDINAGVTGCFEKYEKSLALKDGDCSSYFELTDCVFASVTKVCQLPKPV